MAGQSISNSEQIAFWNGDAGSRWVTFQERIDAAFAPITAAVLEHANPQLGEIVLDIGCGCGETVLQLANSIGPDANVLGVDVSEPMLTLAKRRSQARGLSNVKFATADASTYTFDADSVDLAFSRFGVMFFANPVQAFANIRIALRGRGRLTFVCWRSLSENPWFAVPLEAAKPHLSAPLPVADPHAPGPLAFADPDRVRQTLEDANFTRIQLRPFDTKLRLGTRASATGFLMQLGPLGRLLDGADANARAAVAGALDHVLREHEESEEVSLGAGVWLVSARPR
jgi:SAM-dependent methyltransferase